MTQTETKARLYVGTYAKYNNGSIQGAWLNIEDYSNAAEFMSACFDLHKDEHDPELMFQDFEGFPRDMYGESMGEQETQKIYDSLELLEKLDNLSADEWVDLHNQYCNSINSEDTIYEFTDTFFDEHFPNNPTAAAKAASFGTINWSHDYIMFDGYGNLKSIPDYSIESEIDKDAIRRDVRENPENYNI